MREVEMDANTFGSAHSAETLTPQPAEFLLELLTVEEIAASLRVPPSWVYERVRRSGKEKIPHLKIGKYLRFRLGEVRVWVEQQRVQA
jgi:excisionase family DNA binding protein